MYQSTWCQNLAFRAEPSRKAFVLFVNVRNEEINGMKAKTLSSIFQRIYFDIKKMNRIFGHAIY